MLGAIIGDLAGSIYEFAQIKNVKKVECNKIIEDNSFISDDSVLTIAILDAALTDKNYGRKLREYISKYKMMLPDNIEYFETLFSPSLVKWSMQNEIGTSTGNGAMMRISAIGNVFNSEDEVIENAKNATIPSHNSESAIRCATIIALIIFYARNGYSKEEIIKKLNINLKLKKFTKFNYICEDTIDNCLYVVFNSNSFEDSIRNILLLGGDTDTNACIVGSIAESLYGIPDELVKKAKEKLPKEFIKILDGYYNK